MGLLGFGRPQAAQLLRHGQSLRGHVVGIRVSYTRGASPTRVDDYAVGVTLADGMRIYGVRQQLRPDEHVRLGLAVIARVDGKAAIIDWQATCSMLGGVGETITAGWKPLREPPHEGVDDSMLDLVRAQRRGMPARAAISAIRSQAAVAGVAPLDLDLLVRNGRDAPFTARLSRVQVPFYARHLCEQGMELPAFVRTGRVDLDWPTAARNFMAIEAARRG